MLCGNTTQKYLSHVRCGKASEPRLNSHIHFPTSEGTASFNHFFFSLSHIPLTSACATFPSRNTTAHPSSPT